ncbi:hypothetical protein FDP44_10685 [Coxiella burnetii]|nr:hypothetical protein FDP44_10685 [Coxiella burnetii]
METACYLVYEYDEEYPLRVGLIIVGVQEKEDQEGRLERLFGVHPPGKSDPLSQKLQVFCHPALSAGRIFQFRKVIKMHGILLWNI